jgi:hypothetical protein
MPTPRENGLNLTIQSLVQRNFVHVKFTTLNSNRSRRVDRSRELRTALIGLRDKQLFNAYMSGRASIADEHCGPSGFVVDESDGQLLGYRAEARPKVPKFERSTYHNPIRDP